MMVTSWHFVTKRQLENALNLQQGYYLTANLSFLDVLQNFILPFLTKKVFVHHSGYLKVSCAIVSCLQFHA